MSAPTPSPATRETAPPQPGTPDPTGRTRTDPPGRHTPRRKFLLALHLVASVGLIGADLALLTLGISGRAGSAPQAIYPAMNLLATWLIAPLAVLALSTGVWLAVRTRWGLLRYWWVTIKLAVTATLTALVLFVVRPGLGRAADAASSVAPQALLTEAQRLLFVITPSVALTLLLLNAALAIAKPGWRVPRASRRNGRPAGATR